jgi:hypothetical protein
MCYGILAQGPPLGLDYLRAEANAVLKHLEARENTEKVHNVLSDVASLAGCTPKKIGESEAWACVVRRAEFGRVNLCKVMEGKSPFGVLNGLYTFTLIELKAVLQNSAAMKHMPAAPSPLILLLYSTNITTNTTTTTTTTTHE